MSLKTISIGAVARALAATSLIAGVVAPSITVAAEQLSPADALAAKIAAAVEAALATATPATAEKAMNDAISATIVGETNLVVVRDAIAKAEQTVSTKVASMGLAPAVVAAARNSTAFTTQSNQVVAAIATGATGNRGNGPGGGNRGSGVGNLVNNSNQGGNGNGGGGGGGGSHRD